MPEDGDYRISDYVSIIIGNGDDDDPLVWICNIDPPESTSITLDRDEARALIPILVEWVKEK